MNSAWNQDATTLITENRKIVLFAVGGVRARYPAQSLRFLISHCPSIRVTVESLEDTGFASIATEANITPKRSCGRWKNCIHADALKGIGVTWHDLFLPMLKYVYGTAQVEGRCAVFSLCRLHPRFYSAREVENTDLFDCRVEKTLLHEIAHTFGLTHCHSPECVMYSSCRIEDTDCKNPDFCPFLP